MAKTPSLLALVFGAALAAGCAGDDTVNPLPPPDASTSDASKDATAGDGSTAHDGSTDGKAGENEAGPKDAASDSSTTDAAADATSTDGGDAGADAPADAAPDGD